VRSGNVPGTVMIILAAKRRNIASAGVVHRA
jgi:hypothetical protein